MSSKSFKLKVSRYRWAWVANLVYTIKRWRGKNVSWWRSELAEFKPQVIYNSDLRLTEMILEDTSIVWCPWGPFEGHAVDCGYSIDGRLVGIQIWDDVRARPVRS